MLKYLKKTIISNFTSYAGIILVSSCLYTVSAESILIYDEEKGIISVDKDKAPVQKKKESKSSAPSEKSAAGGVPAPAKSTPFKNLHVNRKNDPPELYFKSGLKYYEDHDYENALKNFQYALDKGNKAEYMLWTGKTYRRMDDYKNMLRVMDKIIKRYPRSDVADDALFETAFYYQKQNDYYKATMKYRELAEQYPFGTAYSNGSPFLEVSRNQRRIMKAEMISTLKILGYDDPDLDVRYRAFQKDHNLPLTGKADRATVNKLKKVYGSMLDKDRMSVSLEKRLGQILTMFYAVAAIILISFISIIVVRFKLKFLRNQYISLYNILSDLNTDKI